MQSLSTEENAAIASKNQIDLLVSEGVKSLSIDEVALTKVRMIVGQGDEQRCWIIDEKMLCERYAYFRAAFQGGWRETQTKTLILSEDDPKSFGLIIDLMLHGRANVFRHFGNNDEAVKIGLCKAYVLSDMFGCEDLADKIRHMYLCWMCPAPTGFLARNVSEEAAQFVLWNTMEGDLLQESIRKFLSANVPLWPLPTQN